MAMSTPLTSEMKALLALHLVPGIGTRLTTALLERCGSATATLQATAEQLQQVPHIGGKLARGLVEAFRTLDVDIELDLMAKHGVWFMVRSQEGYPESLVNIPDPPHLLFGRGELKPADTNAVALVGSRSCTAYGRRMAERLGGELARAGFTIVSGLARGIDGTAHRTALQGGGRTVAVLAGGLSKIYPPEHADLASEIEARGALVTEAPMRMEPMAGMFPNRNRLISGLSRGVIVIEAAEKSGALITARHAAEQGRPVFAVPGPVDSAASAGAHQLVRQGAILIRSAEDVIEELDGVRIPPKPQPAQSPPGLDETQRRIWEFLHDRPRHMDEMVQELTLTVPQIASALMMMEMKKIVRRLPGNRFERR
jgi:DNA processing protein